MYLHRTHDSDDHLKCEKCALWKCKILIKFWLQNQKGSHGIPEELSGRKARPPCKADNFIL
jgi:hypothetical protein